MPEIPDAQILAEPAQRNTAPAIGLAAHILQSIDPDAVMGVFPSDHVIGKPRRYLQLVRAAFRAAGAGSIAVLGIQPRWPETGYGYIEFPQGVKPGALEPVPVRRFREKPDAARPPSSSKAGHFYWNAGMFFWRTPTCCWTRCGGICPRPPALLARCPRFGDASFAARARRGLSAVREHLDRLRRAGARRQRGGHWPATTSAGTTWEAGTPSTNCCHAMRDGNCATRISLRRPRARGNYVDAGGKLVALLGVKT